jgi:hypothetical protein
VASESKRGKKDGWDHFLPFRPFLMETQEGQNHESGRGCGTWTHLTWNYDGLNQNEIERRQRQVIINMG